MSVNASISGDDWLGEPLKQPPMTIPYRTITVCLSRRPVLSGYTFFLKKKKQAQLSILQISSSLYPVCTPYGVQICTSLPCSNCLTLNQQNVFCINRWIRWLGSTSDPWMRKAYFIVFILNKRPRLWVSVCRTLYLHIPETKSTLLRTAQSNTYSNLASTQSKSWLEQSDSGRSSHEHYRRMWSLHPLAPYPLRSTSQVMLLSYAVVTSRIPWNGSIQNDLLGIPLCSLFTLYKGRDVHNFYRIVPCQYFVLCTLNW